MSEKTEERMRLNEQEKKLKEMDWENLDWHEYLCDCCHGGSTAPTIRHNKEKSTK